MALGKRGWLKYSLQMTRICLCLLSPLALLAAYSGRAAAAEYPPTLPRLMMITWRAFSAEDMAAYRRNGLDTVFKILGATDWSFVESKRGECDFSRLRSSLQLAKDAGLHAIPTISFDNPPPWFTDTYPDSVPRYSDGSAPKSGKISLAWLIEKHRAKYERHEEAPDYEALESYIKATLTELQRWDNVIGVEIPWRTFAGAFFYKPGAKEEKKSQTLEKYPQLAILGGFDPWFKARWQRPEPIPATWEEYKKQSADLQEYWQNWGEQANGEAAKILLTLAHRNAPNYLIVLRKHIWVRTTDPAWMSPDLATVMQLNERQFRVFLDHVKAFSDETGWKGVMFDNDAFFDKSKANNSLATRDLVAKSGFLYMGEGNTSEEDTWQSGAIANIKAVRPDAFAFIPAPGRRGGNIANEKEQIIIRLMREPAKKQDARTP